MKVSVFLARACSALQKKTVYESPGVMPSFAATNWPNSARNDCSGFVDWCLRFAEDRRVNHPLYIKVNGGWFETTAIHADGNNPTGYFSQIDTPRPGAMLVYPDYVDIDQKKQDGHIGIVVETDGGAGIEAVKKVIHCSEALWQHNGDAIQITRPDKWLEHANSIIIWWDAMEP